MTKTFRYTVRFRLGRSTMDLAGVLDMLRYDAATIRDWNRLEGDLWSITFTTAQPATIARWQSFSLLPKEM